jgi:hypothetical protein
MTRLLFLGLTHATAVAIGFVAGIYALPILIAPPAPSSAEVEAAAQSAAFTTQFRRDLPGSDRLHWGEGVVSVGKRTVSLVGSVAPGPDYRLYLAPEAVVSKQDFLQLKERSVQIGEVKTFDNFIVAVPDSVDVTRYRAVVVWCESFSQFITAAQYR